MLKHSTLTSTAGAKWMIEQRMHDKRELDEALGFSPSVFFVKVFWASLCVSHHVFPTYDVVRCWTLCTHHQRCS